MQVLKMATTWDVYHGATPEIEATVRSEEAFEALRQAIKKEPPAGQAWRLEDRVSHQISRVKGEHHAKTSDGGRAERGRHPAL